MATDSNKDNLRKLLAFMNQQILHKPENAWFEKELYGILAPNADARISDIHEQCIESILRQQAEEFYKNFVIEGIKPQLINDFVKMESWRRRNNINEFGMAMFQQIECIINKLGQDKQLAQVCYDMMNALCYVDSMKPIVSNRYSKSTYTIARLLFIDDAAAKSKSDLSVQWINDKFKCINYFVCHRACLTSQQFTQFTSENDIFNQIRCVRNRNHRGNTPTEYETLTLLKVDANISHSFFLFSSFFCWFIDSINEGYPLSKELIEFSRGNFKASSTPFDGLKIKGKIDLPEDNKKRFK
jgi:hypothetical protein